MDGVSCADGGCALCIGFGKGVARRCSGVDIMSMTHTVRQRYYKIEPRFQSSDLQIVY